MYVRSMCCVAVNYEVPMTYTVCIWTVQEEGLTNDLHKQAHDKKHFRITNCVHNLGSSVTAFEVGLFSSEISQLLKMRPPPLFEEPHAHRPWVYFLEITVSQRFTHPSL